MFEPPQFNVNFDVWIPGHSPIGGPKDFSSPGQLYQWSHTFIPEFLVGLTRSYATITIRFPFDITTNWGFPFPMVGGILGWQDEFTNWWYYNVLFWERQHTNFPNQYFAFACFQCDGNGNHPDPAR